MFQFKISVFLQCNTSADLIKCIEGGTYSREEALVHASVGFDARFVLILFFFLVDLITLLMVGSRLPLMEAALWKEEFTYMKFGRSYTLRLPRR